MALTQIVIFLSLGYRMFVLVLSGAAYFEYKRRRKYNHHIPAILRNRYIFLFPVFHEQKIIEETFRYYERFVHWFSQIEILFVITDKEKDTPSTGQIICDLINKSAYRNRITCISCPNFEGTKATQVNFALEYIRSKNKEIPYIVSFDCDARIRWQDFLLADQYIREHVDHVVYSFLPRPDIDQRLNFFVRATMLHHGERMLAFEYPSKLALGFNYPMGATIIYSPKLWKYISYIPEPIDDLALKYILDCYQQSYVAMPFSTSIQAPPSSRNIYRQMIPVFSGVFSYFQTLRYYGLPIKIENIFLGSGFYVFYVLEYLSILLLLLAILNGNILLSLLFFCQVLLDLIFLEKLSLSNFFLHLIGYGIRLSQFVYFLFYKLLSGEDLCQFKTERGISKVKEKCVTMT